MKTNIIIPIIAGAAITAGLAYLFTTDEGEELRGKIADGVKEYFPQVGEQFAAVKDKFMENLGQQS